MQEALLHPRARAKAPEVGVPSEVAPGASPERSPEGAPGRSPGALSAEDAAALFGRVVQGDRAAARRCVELFAPLVWSVVRRRLAGPDAEDAVQDIFLALFQSAGRYDPSVAAPSTFVVMIARRRLIDRRRAEQRTPVTEALDGAETRPTDGLAEQTAEAALARRAMVQLRPEQRRVLELALDRDMTYSEIAEETGMPLGTVKAHARRALLRLRALLFGSPGREEAHDDVPA